MRSLNAITTASGRIIPLDVLSTPTAIDNDAACLRCVLPMADDQEARDWDAEMQRRGLPMAA